MNLIIQGAEAEEVETPDLKHLAKLSGATGIEAILSHVFRLRDAQPHADIALFCEQKKLDWGFVPEQRKLNDYGLVVMDMDSTLITIECIDEIADFHGFKEKVANITAAAMRGEMDFKESLRQRVDLLEGTGEDALARVYEERLKLSPGADHLLTKLRDSGIKTLLVSGGFTFFTERLRARLALDYAHSNTLEIIDGKLTGRVIGDIVDADDKLVELRRVRDMLGLRKEQVIGIGDGANDLKFLAECGVSFAYRAKPVVRAQTTYALNFVGLDGVLNLLG
jgi:phosphoserine phosphatase